jgi:uncharacterized membrane protein
MYMSRVKDVFGSASTAVANGMARFAPALFLVWLTIASAYMPELAGCQVRRMLGTSMVAKHLVGLIMIYFTVVVVNPGIGVASDTLKNILFACCIYLWFVLTSRCHFYVILLVVMIVFQTHILHQRLQDDAGNMSQKQKQDTQRLIVNLSLISLIITVLGVYLYMIAKMKEYGDEFSHWYFFVGRMRCDSLRPGSTELIESE